MASSLFGTQSTPQPSQPIQKQNNGLQSLKNMMRMFKAAQNPQAFVMSMMANDPQAANVTNLIQKHGGDAKAAFYDLAKQKGIDPEEFLRELNS